MGEWVAQGRPAGGIIQKDRALSVNELILSFWTHAQTYYVKDGKPTSQLSNIRRVLKELRRGYGMQPVTEFGPLALKASARFGSIKDWPGRLATIRRICSSWSSAGGSRTS